jgi:hypothetical protein
MARERSSKHKHPLVGDEVGVRVGRNIRRARIIEDRGNLGVGGRRLVRVVIEEAEDAAADGVEFELPEERLEALS